MAFSQLVPWASLHFAKISLHLPKMQGGDRFHGGCIHHHAVRRLRRFPTSSLRPLICGGGDVLAYLSLSRKSRFPATVGTPLTGPLINARAIERSLDSGTFD